jgi:hypothetical protein
MRTEYTFWLTATLAATIVACDGNGGGGQGGSGGSTSTMSGGGGSGGDTSTGGTGGGTSTGGAGGSTGGAGGSTGGTGGSSGQPYPPPPYGYDVGSIIENYGFVGYPAPMTAPDTLGTVQLGDFYNPTGQATFPAGSPYGAGAPMPERLLIQVSAVWSGPDNFEADMIIPSVLATYGPCLQVLTVLIDGPTPGQAASTQNAYNWAQSYAAAYPVCIDPAFQLAPILVADAFPGNILIDTLTMEIVDVVAGVPDPASPFFQSNVASVCP